MKIQYKTQRGKLIHSINIECLKKVGQVIQLCHLLNYEIVSVRGI
jgi:hypothetical protein